MSKRRANSSLTTEQWLLITGGVAALGVGVYFLVRKPSTASGSTSGSNTTTPSQVSAIADDSAFLQTPQTQAAIAATNTPAPFSFGLDPATTYNPQGAQLGDPNDPNSAASACVIAHNYMTRGTPLSPDELAVVNQIAAKCLAAGGRPNW